MKDKFKNISNNLKNLKNNINKNKSIKFILITTLIALSVYLLYFNDKIFVQDAIVNSLNEETNDKESIIENFNVAKYVDICKNRKTNFYNVSLPTGITLNTIETSNCELKCDEEDCDAFIMQDIIESENQKCITYKGNVDSSGIDQNDISINVNCNSTILPEDKYGTYIGYGYINKKYFENNKKDKFKYADAYLEESNKFINILKTMNSKYDDLKNADSNYREKTDAINDEASNIGAWIANFATSIGFDSSKLFTVNNNNFMDLNYDITKDPKQIALKDIYNASQRSRTLEYKEKDINKSGISNYLFYIILAFVMVITIILLILYKLNNNIISNGFMTIYFIIIVSIFAFIQYGLKI